MRTWYPWRCSIIGKGTLKGPQQGAVGTGPAIPAACRAAGGVDTAEDPAGNTVTQGHFRGPGKDGEGGIGIEHPALVIEDTDHHLGMIIDCLQFRPVLGNCRFRLLLFGNIGGESLVMGDLPCAVTYRPGGT